MDRFGDPPPEVLNLLSVAKFKIYAKQYGIHAITQKKDEIMLEIDESQLERIDGQKLYAVASRFDGRVKLNAGPQIKIVLQVGGLKSEQIMSLVESFLEAYQEGLKSEELLPNAAK